MLILLVFIVVAAKMRYEELKKKTQDELKATLDDLLEGEDKIKSRRWDFDMDISAPQIIIPESFSDQNTILVVFDLGHLQFHNLKQLQSQASVDASEDNDG